MLRPAEISSFVAAPTATRSHVLWVVGIVPDKMGGFERTCAEFAKQAAERGACASFVFEGEPCAPLANALAEFGAHYFVISEVGKLGVKHSWRLARIVQRIRPDIVHLHFCELYRPFFLLSSLLRVPLVATYHYSGEPVPAHGLRRLLKTIRRFCMTGALTRVSAVSNAAREKLAEDYLQDRSRILITYNGTDLADSRNASKPASDETSALESVACASPKLLYVGALNSAKGVHYAIRAIALLVRDFPGIHLTIVGAGPDQADLETLTRDLGIGGHVQFAGLRSDVPRFLAAHEIMVVPSIWHEAFGYVVVEAMAAGCPVIATKVGGIPELIDHENDGLLVEPADERGLAAAISRLAKDPSLRACLAQRAALKAREVFALDRSVARFWNLYT